MLNVSSLSSGVRASVFLKPLRRSLGLRSGLSAFFMKVLVLLGCLCCLAVHVVARPVTSCGSVNPIVGRIIDAFGDPITGGTVYAIRSNTFAQADALGRFRLAAVGQPDTLIVRAIGYTTQRVAIGADSSSSLTITLQPLSVNLIALEVRPEADATADLARVDNTVRPATNSQELLQLVPGLVIGQHAGGGKAEQIFIRGFDVDHGTDVAIDFDGIPVNMVSHAHGQGYADLHFIIPETVANVAFTKGPYDVGAGNFATAGSVSLSSNRRLQDNMLRVEGGQFGFGRIVALLKAPASQRLHSYAALEYVRNDGPFESPQGLERYNAFAKTHLTLARRAQLTVSASHFSSTWRASGQIPERAVRNGRIGRFGAIDDTEGGTTSRSNLSLTYTRPLGAGGLFTAQVYASRYGFELYSNFTFYLVDSLNGDQIVQRENRWLGGGRTSYTNRFQIADRHVEYELGLQLRADYARDTELSRTANRRELLERLSFGDVSELSPSAYSRISATLGPVHCTIGARYDATRFGFTDRALAAESVFNTTATLNSSIQFRYSPKRSVQTFLKVGSGYHANDARLVTGGTSPTYMPRAYGVDAGGVLQLDKQITATVTAWALSSEQEFVYVGDAGVVEPSGRSRRYGIDLGLRYQFGKAIRVGGDVSLAHARSIDEPAGSDRIPLAPPLSANLFAIYNPPTGFHASARMRVLADRPANEDYSITARGYAVTDLTLGYTWRPVSLDVVVENLLDVDWNETQFATASRLRAESAAVEEIHFTPGVPRFGRLRASWRF